MSPALDPGLGGWPEWARVLVKILTGDEPPSALPQKAVDAGQVYERLARDIDQLMEMARNVSLKIGDGMPEEARKQFQGVVDSFTSGRGKTRLDEFTGQLHGVRLDLEDKSRQIYEMYWQVMAALIQMLALLAWVAFLAAFGFGGLAGLQAQILNQARVAVLAGILQLLQRVKVLPGVFEAFEEALLSFAVQLANKVFGNKLFKRDSLDWGAIGKDALFGFFAGGIGEILGGAFNKGKDLLSKVGRNSPDFGNGVKNQTNWDRVVKEGYGNANDFVSEGFGESLGAAAMGLFFAGYSFSWATFVSAGSSGVVERNLEGGAEGGARWLRNKFVNPPPTPDGVNRDSGGAWPTRTSDPNSGSGPGSTRSRDGSNDRSSGTNGRSGPRTDISSGGGTRRRPLTTSDGDRNGTGGTNPSPSRTGSTRRDGGGNPNGTGGRDSSGIPNGNGSGSTRPPGVATSTRDLPDLSTYQPGGDTPSPGPSMPTPDAFRSNSGQDPWQLPNQSQGFLADPGGSSGTTPSNGQGGRPLTVTGPGSTGGDVIPDGQRPGQQPVPMPVPAADGSTVQAPGTNPTSGTNPPPGTNPSDPVAATRPVPQPGSLETSGPAFQTDGGPIDTGGTSVIESDGVASDTGTIGTGTTDGDTSTTDTRTTGVTGTGNFSESGPLDREVTGQSELTVDQQEALITQGAILRASAPGQDSLVLALEASAPDLVTGTPTEIRTHLADALVAELNADPGAGSRPLWDAVDEQSQAAVAADRTADRLRVGDPLPRSEIYQQELRAVHDTWGDDNRRSLAHAMRTYTTASDATDDVLPLVAGRVYGLTVNVVQPDGSMMLVGSPDGRSVTVARLPRNRRTTEQGHDRDRWLAAARPEDSPEAVRLSTEAFQQRWEQLPTDTVGFARAATAARSLLAEHGRVAGPFTSTPFSDLDGVDRAARRLAVVLHGDRLYQDLDRRDEALAWALHLLGDPAPPRPVTESSAETDTVSDAVSTTGTDLDTLVEEQEQDQDQEQDHDSDATRMSERSFQRRWDKLKRDTPELAEAAAAARSLLAEHGRVTDPLSSTPFADLDDAGRAARRLTHTLHTDPGLRTDPARRTEARAWALQLLEDPLFPHGAARSAPGSPATESSAWSDEDPDTSSLFSVSSVSSVSSDEGWEPLTDVDDSDVAYADPAEHGVPSERAEPGTPSPPAYEERAVPPAEPQPELPSYAEGDAAPSYPADRVNPAGSPALVSAVSKHLRADRGRTARLLAYQWFDVKAVDRLRRELGLRRSSDLLDLAESIGRVPEDLPRIAAEMGLTPVRLYKMARDLGADPRHVSAVLGPALREGGDRAARDLARSAGWTLGARDGHPEAGSHPQGKGWLLAVAAHYQVSWEGLTYPGQGLAHYLARRTSTAPVLTPPDHINLAELVEEWGWDLGFGPRGGRFGTAAWELDSKSPPPEEETAPSVHDQVARASQRAVALVDGLLTNRGATLTPQQRAALAEAASAHLFRDPADTEGAGTAAARLLDETKRAAEAAKLRTNLPFDPTAFDRLWESARREAVGESLDSALADARGLVGPLRRLPASIDRDTAPYHRLGPADQVVRRVAHHLYTWPGDTEGARALAQRLVGDLPAAPVDPFRRVGGANPEKTAQPVPQQPTASTSSPTAAALETIPEVAEEEPAADGAVGREPPNGQELAASEQPAPEEPGPVQPPASTPGIVAPAFVRGGAIGSMTVETVPAWTEQRARLWAAATTLHLDGAIRPEVEEAVVRLLLSTTPEAWSALLRDGVRLAVGDKLVWLLPTPADLAVPVPGSGPAPGALTRYRIAFGSTSYSGERSTETSTGLESMLQFGFQLASAFASAATAGVPHLGLSFARGRSSSWEQEVISGLKPLTRGTATFVSSLRIQIFLDGVQQQHSVVVPRDLGVEFPKIFSAPPAPLRLDSVSSPSDIPAGRESAADHTQGTLHALDLVPVVAGIQARLRGVGLRPDAAASVSAEIQKVVSEAAALDRSRFWFTSGDRTAPIRRKLSRFSEFRGHLVVRAEVTGATLREVTDALRTRADLGLGATRGQSRSGSSGASLSFGNSVLGLTHDPVEDRPRGVLPLATVTVGSTRSDGFSTSAKTQSHTVLNTAAQEYARYDAEVRLSVTIESDTHPGIEPVVLETYGEIGVPWRYGQGAADWETRTLGAIRTPGLDTHANPGTGAVDGPDPDPQPEAGPSAAVTALLAAAGLPTGARPAPATPDPAHSSEPLPLAARTQDAQGLGFSTLLALPGSESVLEGFADALRSMAGTTKVTAPVLHRLSVFFGTPALEGSLADLLVGRTHVLNLNGNQYRLGLRATLGRRLGGADYPLTVNTRATAAWGLTGSMSTGWSVSGALGAALRVPAGTRLRMQLGALRGRLQYDRERGDELVAAVKETNRHETGGLVHQGNYELRWALAVHRMSSTGTVRQSRGWELDTPGGTSAQLLLPKVFAPPTPYAPAVLGPVGTVTRYDREPADLAGEARADLTTSGSSGVRPTFLAVRALGRHLAEVYQDLNGMTGEWLADSALWPEEFLEATGPDTLAAYFGALTSAEGFEVALPDRDGWKQRLTLRVAAYNARGQGTTSDPVEIEQYSQLTSRRAIETGSAVTGALAFQLGPQGSWGGDEAAETDEEDGSPQQEQQGGGATKSRAAGILQVTGSAVRGTSLKTAEGMMSISRATYGGTKDRLTADPVFHVRLDRRKGVRAESGERWLRVQAGLEMLMPTWRAAEILRPAPAPSVGAVPSPEPEPEPEPSADPSAGPSSAMRSAVPGATPPAPPTPPHTTPTHTYAGQLLRVGVAHPEVFRADGALGEIQRLLSARGVTSPGVLDAVRSAFSPRSLAAQVPALLGSGVLRVIPKPSPFGTTEYLAVSVRMESVAAAHAQTDHPDVELTGRAQGSSEEADDTTTGYSFGGEAGVKLRLAAEGSGASHGHGGFEAIAGYSRSRGAGTTSSTSELDIHRLAVGGATAFTHAFTLRVGISMSKQPMELVSAPIRLVTGAYAAAMSTPLLAGGLGLRFNPALGTGLGRYAQWQETATTAGSMRLLVPTRFTVPNPAAVTADGTPDPAPAPLIHRPRGENPRWADPAPEGEGRDGVLASGDLAGLLADHVIPLDMPAAHAVQQWARYAPAPVGRRPDLAAIAAEEHPGLSPSELTTMAGLRYAHATSTEVMRPRLEDLLRGSYEVPVGSTTRTVRFELSRLRRFGPSEGTDLTARRYQQSDSSAEASTHFSSGVDTTLGPDGGGDSDGVRLFERLVGSYGRSSGEDTTAGQSRTEEANAVSQSVYGGLEADLTVTVGGVLRFDVPAGLHLLIRLDGKGRMVDETVDGLLSALTEGAEEDGSSRQPSEKALGKRRDPHGSDPEDSAESRGRTEPEDAEGTEEKPETEEFEGADELSQSAADALARLRREIPETWQEQLGDASRLLALPMAVTDQDRIAQREAVVLTAAVLYDTPHETVALLDHHGARRADKGEPPARGTALLAALHEALHGLPVGQSPRKGGSQAGGAPGHEGVDTPGASGSGPRSPDQRGPEDAVLPPSPAIGALVSSEPDGLAGELGPVNGPAPVDEGAPEPDPVTLPAQPLATPAPALQAQAPLHQPVPVPDMTTTDWVRAKDSRDATLLFAPPEAFTTPTLRQSAGAGTFDLPDQRLHAAIRDAVLDAVPDSAREGVRRELEDRFSAENFISELPQAIGDRLVLGLQAGGRRFEAAVRVRVGDWRQLTDPHGRRLPGTEDHLPPTVSAKREPRTRQLFESGESVGSSRTRAHGVALPAALLLNHSLEAIPHLSSVAAVFSSVLAGYSAASTSTVSSGATTARYTKGTFRAVDFLYDVLYDVTVQAVGASRAPRQHQAVLEGALVGRHDRQVLRSRPKPPEGVTHATSAWWATPEQSTDDADSQEESGIHTPATPYRWDAGTTLLRNVLGSLGRHRERAAANTTAYQEWWPFGRPRAAGGTDPAVTVTVPNQQDIPLHVPRTSVVESFDHTEELRRAVLSVLPDSMSRVGTPEKAAIDAFTAVHSIAGALHRAMSGGYLSVPFNTGGGATQAVELRTDFLGAQLVTEEDGTAQVDWMIHIDTEDVNVDNVAHRNSGSDAMSLSSTVLLGANTGKFASTVSLPALGGNRSVGVSDPGQQAGSVTLHKIKLEEPTVVLTGRTRTTVRGRGGVRTVDGTARLRILLQDAVRLGLMDGRRVPRATVDGPQAGNFELHARTSPDRNLRFAPALGSWLPQLSRVDQVNHDDAGRLLDRVMSAVRAAAPGMLPPETGEENQAAKAHEHTNLMTVANLVRPEPLAARLHDIMGGGISVVLSRPALLTGPQEVVLTLSGTLAPDTFTHQGMWDGNSETYYGGFYELQGSRSTAYSVEGGFDVPLNHTTSPDWFTIRGAGGRIAPRVGTSWVTTTGGGFSVGGASGGGSRFMAGFEGAVHINVTVTPSRRTATPEATAELPGALTDGGGEAIEMTPVGPTTGTAAHETAMTAAEEGRAGQDTNAPVELNLRLMVADDLLEEQGPDGVWRDSVSMRSHLDPDTRVASRELHSDPQEPPLVHVPGENERLPLHTLFLADTSTMHAAVDGLLTDLNVSLEPSEQVGLHTALNAMGSRVEDFIGGSRPFWTRTVGRDAFGMPKRIEISLRATVKEMRTRGVSQTSYQYDHTLTTASVSDSATRDLISMSGSLGANLSLTSDPRPQGYGGTAAERNAATDNSHTGVAGYRYGRGAPRTLSASAEGQSDRVDIVTGPQEHIHARMEYRLVAKVSSRSPVALGLDPATAHTYGERTAHRTIEDAHALLVIPAGRAERMREASRRRADETGIAGPLPQSPVPVITVDGGPFPSTHPADGLGHAVLYDIPDLTPVVEQARDALFRRLDPDHAELVLTRLRAALASRQGAKAALEPMASGVFRIVVPYRGALSTALAVVTARIDLSRPVHTGEADTLHVIEGKNVRRDDVSASASHSWSHSGNAGWNYGHNPHDTDGPVVDGGGGGGFGVTYGQGRSLGASLGQTRSSGMLHVDAHPALVAYDVAISISLDLHWGATASTALVGPVLTLIGRHTRYALAEANLPGALTLAYPQQLMQPGPPRGTDRPAPRTIPAHEAVVRTGLRPEPEDLTESFIGTIAGLRDLLAQAEDLLEQNAASALGGNSWHGARAHVGSRLAVVFSMAWLHQRTVHLLSGGTLRVPLTVPGAFMNEGLTLVLSLDYDSLTPTSTHGAGEGTITGTIVKDFRRSHRSVGGGVDAALDLRGSLSLRSGLATEGPDVLRPGITAEAGRTRGTGQSGGGLSSMLESGDKSMGTWGAELDDPAQRKFAHLSVGRARWNIGLERSGGTGFGVQVTVEQDALTFFAPEERAAQLLALEPKAITGPPLVGAEPARHGLRRLMPGGWPPGTDTDTEPAEVNPPPAEALTEWAQEEDGPSRQPSEKSLGKRRDTRPSATEDSGTSEQREEGFEGVDELSPRAAQVLTRLRRELPSAWQRQLGAASRLLALPLAVTDGDRIAQREAVVLTAAALHDTPHEAMALVEHHGSRQPDKGEPPARATAHLADLHEALRDLPVGRRPGKGGSVPAGRVDDGIDTPGASGSGHLPAAVPVRDITPTEWIRTRDARDADLLFAPPEAFTAPSLRQSAGAGTFDLPDESLHAAIRDAVLDAVPEAAREGMRRELESRFSVENFISELPQAIGDRLVLGLHAGGRRFEAAVRVRVGDWRQLTDAHGRRLAGTENHAPLMVSEKREPRTRQLLESGESVGSSRTRALGLGLPAALLLNHTLEAIPHLGAAAATFSSVLAGYSAASTSTVSSGATTARYTKGTFRAVDFLYDVLYDVTVQEVGGSTAPTQNQAVLKRALVGRHDRQLLRSRPKPAEGEITYATSEWWRQTPGPSEVAEATEIQIPAAPLRWEATTSLLTNALPNLGQHRARTARDSAAYQEWRPFGPPAAQGGTGGTDRATTDPATTDPADTDPATTAGSPNRPRNPLRVPRTSVVESFDHTEELRRAVFSVLPDSMSRVGTPQKAAVDAFTAVHAIAGALHRAMSGGYLSMPFNTGGGATESIELSTVFHDAALVTDEDGTPQVDWLIHIDTEDVNVDNVASRYSGSDAVTFSAAALLDAAGGQLGANIAVPALGGRRAVGMSDPGQQAGSVTLHKIKLEEPTVVLSGRTSTTVRGRGEAKTVEGTARVRILLQDAVRLGLVDERSRPRATVDGPHAGNVELHARTAPGRRLRFAPLLGGWLPQLSRVDEVDHDDAERLLGRVMRAVRAVAPDMLPPDDGNPPANLVVAQARSVRGVKTHEHTNLMTVANLVRPEPLAARLHDIVNGGISVVLSRPGLKGAQEVVLSLSGTIDPDGFTHEGMWDGNSETYYGGFYELQGDRSTSFSVEGGFDAPLGYNSTPDQFTFRGAGGRIGPRLGTSWSSTTGGGFSVGGASGGGSRFMAGFEGSVDVNVTVTRSLRSATAQAPAEDQVPVGQPAAVTEDGADTFEMTDFGTANATDPVAQDAAQTAAEEGRARPDDTTGPVSLKLRLMVADDLLEEQGPDGRWHDSVAMRSHLDPGTGLAGRKLDPEQAEPLVHRPQQHERLPLHTLFLADTSRMHGAVDGLLSDLHVDLEPSERVGLHTAVSAVGSRVQDFIGGSRPFYTRTIGRDAFGMPIQLEIQLQAIVEEMRTRGVSKTSYQYDHTLTTASVSDSVSRDLISMSGSIGVSATFASDPRPENYGGTPEERGAATDHTHTPSLGYRYGSGSPQTLSAGSEGQSDRVDIVTGDQEHIYARMEYRFVGKVSSWSPVPLGTDPATAHTYGERTAPRTIEEAHALLVIPAGRAQRMREAARVREAGTGAAGPSRLSPPSSTGVGGTFPTSHPADGLGHAVLYDIPDFAPVVEDARATLYRHLDAGHAELVLTRLRAALATRQGTKAAIEPMASGVFRIVVPYRGKASTALAVITAKVDLSNPVHAGEADTLHVIEGKNVRRDDVSASASHSWSHSGSAGWGYGHTTHDPSRPVLDGGGGVGFNASYGQGRSLASSLGQTRSSGLLHVDAHPALVRYDVRITLSLDHYWAATATPGLVGPVLTLIGKHTRYELAEANLPGELTLAHPRQLMRTEPPTGPGRPAAHATPAHQAPRRTGLRPEPDDLTESFIGTIGGLRELLAHAEDLLEENVGPALGAHSWHGARAHLGSRLAVVFSMAWLHQRAVHLVGGGTLRVPLTVPGMFTNEQLTLVLSLDHDSLDPVPAEGGATITGTIVKDFRRSHRSVGGAVDVALTLRGSGSLRSGLATEGPDVLRPGITAEAGQTRGTGQSGGGLSSMLESGDKSMGTLGEGLTDSDRRKFAQLSVGRARWNIGLERSGGRSAGVQVTVEQDALTLFAPVERAVRLLALQPEAIAEPLVGDRPPSRGLRGLMPGGWWADADSDTGSDTEQEEAPAQLPEPAPWPVLPAAEALIDLRPRGREQVGPQVETRNLLWDGDSVAPLAPAPWGAVRVRLLLFEPDGGNLLLPDPQGTWESYAPDLAAAHIADTLARAGVRVGAGVVPEAFVLVGAGDEDGRQDLAFHLSYVTGTPVWVAVTASRLEAGPDGIARVRTEADGQWMRVDPPRPEETTGPTGD